MIKIADDIPIEFLVKDYLEMNSSYKVAQKYQVSATAVKRLLKKAGVLRTQNDAAKVRNNVTLKGKVGKYKRTQEIRNKISESKKGTVSWNKGVPMSEKQKELLSRINKERTGKRNPNYKHGKNIRRPRDFKNADIQKLRNFVFNRDGYKCKYCQNKGGNLHAHHLLPYWVKPDAFLDTDNLITVCTKCHFEKAHKSNWACFDTEIINDTLILKYSLDRERLNVLAVAAKATDAIV